MSIRGFVRPSMEGLQDAVLWSPSDFSYTLGLNPVGGGPQIDLTGRGRILVYGPFQMLPVGRWRIEVEFDLDPEGGELFLRFEWGGALEFETLRVKCSRSGRYRVVLHKTWTAEAPAELRVWVDRATLFGSLQMLGATVRPVGGHI
jgi:hypothetical protein